MNQIILFSPVGGTDPISLNNCRDGSLLHICRVYQPTKVILYMSREILENHKKDDRYRYCLNKLCEKDSFSMDIEIIERPDLESVHEFDFYYPEFKEILDRQVELMDDTDKLYLNVSSGTPAMKSALLVLQTLGEIPCHSIQVATPERKMNEHTHRGYDVETLWELNEDNNAGFANRCKETVCPSLSLIKKQELIKRQVLSYDYNGAVQIAESLSKEERKKYWDLLMLAKAREQFDFAEVDRILRNRDDFSLPYTSSYERDFFEYALALELKMKKNMKADFIRAITPLVLDLFIQILKEQCSLDVYQYSIEENGLKWDISSLVNTQIDGVLNQSFRNFKYGIIYSEHLLNLITGLSDNRELKKKCSELRNVERSVRNIAAHQITAITDKTIKELTGKTIGQIMGLIKELFSYSALKVQTRYWDSYDELNRLIIGIIG